MLDKSPEQIPDNNLTYIQSEFKKKNPSLILCSEPFHKVEFLNRLINSIKDPIIFVDMDLLFTGYIESGMIQKKDNVIIFHPGIESWRKILSEIITKVSKEKFLVVIDSFNGVYNMFESDLDSARFINSCVMLLSSIGRQTNSSIVITAMARKKENTEWRLLPGRKQIIQSSKTGIYFLKKIKNDLMITVYEKGDTNSKVFKIEQGNY